MSNLLQYPIINLFILTYTIIEKLSNIKNKIISFNISKNMNYIEFREPIQASSPINIEHFTNRCALDTYVSQDTIYNKINSSLICLTFPEYNYKKINKNNIYKLNNIFTLSLPIISYNSSFKSNLSYSNSLKNIKYTEQNTIKNINLSRYDKSQNQLIYNSDKSLNKTNSFTIVSSKSFDIKSEISYNSDNTCGSVFICDPVKNDNSEYGFFLDFF
jgi:hypothetical protein